MAAAAFFPTHCLSISTAANSIDLLMHLPLCQAPFNEQLRPVNVTYPHTDSVNLVVSSNDKRTRKKL